MVKAHAGHWTAPIGPYFMKVDIIFGAQLGEVD